MMEYQLENLQIAVNNLENYERIRHYVRNLAADRNNVLRSLEENANQFEKYSKYGSISRLIFSVTEIVGTVGGFCMQYFSFKCFNYAFYFSTACGLLNVISSVTESFLFENAVKDIINLVRTHQVLFLEIQRWPQETERLRQEILNICPIDCVEHFIQIAEHTLSTTDFLVFCFRSQTNINQMSRSTFEDLCNWLIFHPNPLVFDAGRAGLQLLYSPVKFLFSQYVPALSTEHQNLLSVPVLGRIALNYGTILRAAMCLWKCKTSDFVSEMRRLRYVLEDQMDCLKFITEYCDYVKQLRLLMLLLNDMEHNAIP